VSAGTPRWSDHRVELAVSRVLRIGLALAAVLVAAGGALHLVRHGTEVQRYRVFNGEPDDLTSVAAIARNALTGSGRGVIQLGVLVLLATPVARVVLSAVAFAFQRDRLYEAVTLIVLAVLAFSLLGGPVAG
jgi:uncharacterized membrane protein